MNGEWFDDDHEQKVDLKLWKQLLSYTLHYRRTVYAFLIVAFGLAASDLCFPIITGSLMSAIEKNPTEVNLTQYAIIFAAASVSLCGFVYGFIACAGKIRTHVSHDIRRDAFKQLQELSFSFYDTKPVGWLMARLTADCNRLSNILAWGVMDFTWGIALMIGISIVMLVYNWQLALTVLAVVPIMFAVSVFFRKRILRTSRLVRKTNSKITASYNESILGVRTSKVFVRSSHNLRDFDRLADDMCRHSIHNSILSAVYLPLVLTLGSIAIAGALVQGGYQVIYGGLTVGDVIMFMYFAQIFFAPIQELSAWFAELQMAQASAERVLSLIESTPEIADSDEVKQRLADTEGIDLKANFGQIVFENVGFSYRSGPQIIEGFNLTVEPGQTIALVGATGGGKSTLVNLLCRFYEPTAGRILFDGVDYRELGLYWLQSNLGIVLQQPHLFSGTIADNIRYGDLDATQADIESAAKRSAAHPFISQLEQGYETEVGEGGAKLSLGQKQLVSFARAILKQPELMVLDEATSSIDTETEQHIQAGLTSLLSGRTSFVIAHRLSTIRSADKILVIEKGKIVEQGTHSQLLSNKGHYHALYTEQSMRDILQSDSTATSST